MAKPPTELLQDRAVAVASGVTNLMGVLLRVWPREASLTTDFVLSYLERVGPQRIGALAEIAGVTQPSMTGLVARLAESGMVERRRHVADGRVVLVAVTEAGAAAIGRRRSVTTAQLAEAIAALPLVDVAALEAALPALLAAASRADPANR
jgi:DNA-binding MarR family transcriptional regulator